MRPTFFTRLVFGVSFLVLMGGTALAQQVQPLDRLLPEIRRTHPGQIYDADGPNAEPDGSQHYHLKWMSPDGRIEWLDTDARTGRGLSASPGRDNFDGPGPPPAYAPAPSNLVPPGFFSNDFRGPPSDDGGGRGGYARDYPAGPPGGYGGPG